jgi:hypothetical protein
MGLFDKIKDLADEHADQVEDAIDKVADLVDDKTGGNYSDKIEKGAEKAKGLIGDNAADDAAGEKGTDQEPPSRLTP